MLTYYRTVTNAASDANAVTAMTAASTLSAANVFTFDTSTNSYDIPGTHIITVTPQTPLGSDITGDALLIFNLIVLPRCDGLYVSVVAD